MTAEIEAGRFLLQYQPKVDLHTSRIVGAEALVRHLDATGRLSPPAAFIGIFEDNGLIAPLTRWVYREAMSFLPTLLAHADESFRLSFNVTPDDLRDEGFFAAFLTALEGREYLVSHLTLELTETTLFEIPADIQHQLTRLREIGLGISMDDFGTGYSSIERLSLLPFTEVKIDRGFVARIETSQLSAKVVDASVAMAHYLNLTSIAEGIERQEQVDFLHNIGCEQGQGFLYSPPLDGEALVNCMDVHFNGERLPAGFISQAILDHHRWHRNFVCNLQQLHAAVQKGRPPLLYFPLSEFDPTECRLGKWMASRQRQLRLTETFGTLDHHHRELHHFAESLWRAVVKGCSNEWRNAQLRTLGRISQRLVAALHELEHEVFSRQQQA